MAERFREVPATELRPHVDPASLPFENTESLDPPRAKVLGQERASNAIRFGMGMKTDGYHVFIVGPPKTGLTYAARTYLEEQARQEPTPPDWCYVYNFKEPDKPLFIRLGAGTAKKFKKDVRQIVDTLQDKISEVFESDDFRENESELQKGLDRLRNKIIGDLSRVAADEGFALQSSQVGMVIIPATAEGQSMSQDELARLSGEEKEALREKSERLQEKMKEAVKKIREAEAEFKKDQDKLKREIALYVVGHHLEPYLEKYKEEPDAIRHLRAIQEDIVENIDDFKKQEGQQPAIPYIPVPTRESAFKKYEINILVDNSGTEGAPVIIESNPIYPNLFGTIERQAMFGALFTDFTMIRPGVLHKANGGYLVMNVLDLLKYYLSYEALKRALRDKEIKIEDLGELYGVFSTRTIRPMPIPLDIKIVLTGDPYLFELLHVYDDRFRKLFKVKAHMDDRMERKEEAALEVARMIGRFCRDKGLRHLDRQGVARILEYSIEKTEDHDKLTLELGDISDLIREADYFASLEGVDLITGKHVQKAVAERIYRSNLVEERIRELEQKNIFVIETEGEKVGQINGVSILMTGDYEFGKPTRITAAVSVGRDGVIAIERESKMSGNIHTKGVMILTGFLKERFSRNKPISLSASLCFEQSYGMVEGDSASSAELFALLSALAGIPIQQGIAVTGSVSQKGEIQAVGGVTKKVESFFELCRSRGLNGRQGLIIPAKNVRNLVLKEEVVAAVREGLFHIWPVETVEEGIEILTGMEAGKPRPDGTYPEGTVFGKVNGRLDEIAEIVRRYGREQEKGKEESEAD